MTKPGVHFRKEGVEFTVHSRANRLWLLLFDDPEAAVPVRELEMSGGPLWHTVVKGVAPGTLYLYRTDAVPEQWLLDPYARAVHTPRGWGETAGLQPGERLRTGRHVPKCVVIDSPFDWDGDRPPRTPLSQTVLYEAHLRGFTRAESDGTYLDFIGKIPYLKALGITAVEFLPLFEFNELEFFHEGRTRHQLLNFWGYSPIAFFAPMSRYAASREPGAAVTEFKTLVRELHRAGIEVILDVVFNHTGEGPFNGPVYNFRGLDEAAYYLLGPDGSYPDWSGCGNTFHCNHPVATQLIVDCLSYWAQEMRVDGFRFDLATVLCRGTNGQLLDNPPVLRAIESAPALKKVKLFAEAWDAQGGYQVGQFPGQRFAEWNGRFRDDVRRFWNQGDSVAALATRLAGSSDLYEPGGGSPLRSVNFITAHDGFTLADLVSYERKHNEINGEQNCDGENHNLSINFGIEGPSDDPAILARRLKQCKNLLATLLLARGVPLLTAGDEVGRTQTGNNNAYCQDNAISWVDWTQLKKNREVTAWTKALLALRKEYAPLHSGAFYTGQGDVEWLAPQGRAVDWHRDRALGMYLPGDAPLLLLFNNEEQAQTFQLPEGIRWRLRLTSDPATKNTATEASVPAASVAILDAHSHA
jgi:glycogen operon protein